MFNFEYMLTAVAGGGEVKCSTSKSILYKTMSRNSKLTHKLTQSSPCKLIADNKEGF